MTPRDEADLVDFDKHAAEVTYDLLHGQWDLDARGVEPHLPFGHGLGYTTFQLGRAQRTADAVVVPLRNVGERAGSAVVQVYGTVPSSVHHRPPKRLVGFRKIRLDAGAGADLSIPVDLRQLDIRIDGGWVTEDAPVELSVGFDAATTQTVGG